MFVASLFSIPAIAKLEPAVKEENSDEDEKFVHKERYYGHCSRSFYVGDEISEEDIEYGIFRIINSIKDENKAAL